MLDDPCVNILDACGGCRAATSVCTTAGLPASVRRARSGSAAAASGSAAALPTRVATAGLPAPVGGAARDPAL